MSITAKIFDNVQTLIAMGHNVTFSHNHVSTSIQFINTTPMRSNSYRMDVSVCNAVQIFTLTDILNITDLLIDAERQVQEVAA